MATNSKVPSVTEITQEMEHGLRSGNLDMARKAYAQLKEHYPDVAEAYKHGPYGEVLDETS